MLDDGGDVSRGGDMDLCGVDTVLSGAVSGGRCDLGRVSGDGDTDVSGVDTVVSGAVSGCLCDFDSVSRGDLVVHVGEMSLSGGGDAVVPGVDESVCYVHSVLADSILDMCGVDTVASGVDEYVCGVSSVMTADELDVCGCDSVVSDATGEVVSLDSVDDVVACGDDPLLPDAVRVVDRLSVVCDTLVCGAGVAWSDRGNTEAVVGSGVAQRGWVNRLMFADDSLRPEPPPYAMCLCRSLLAAA